MKRFRIILILTMTVLASGSFTLEAKNDINETAEWINQQYNRSPYFDGKRVYRPEMTNNDMVISDIIEVYKEPAEQLFLKALTYAKLNCDGETSWIEDVDFENYQFSIRGEKFKLKEEDPTSYSFVQKFLANDGLLSFSCAEMKAYEKAFVSKNQKFEKLTPQSNPKHVKIIEDLTFWFSGRIADMKDFIEKEDDLKVTHYDDILNGNLVKGMRPEEVILTIGKPYSIKKSGDRDKWVYDQGRSLIFTDGKVTHITW